MRFMVLVKATKDSEAGDFLVKLGRPAEARGEFERAATLTRNVRERDFLLRRAADCAS